MPKSTILYYLGQGLLPAPRKTSPNMAYYDPACVERIKLIQQMQERHRLTLSEIKQCLDDENRGSELGVYLELSEEAFGPGRPRRPGDVPVLESLLRDPGRLAACLPDALYA